MKAHQILTILHEKCSRSDVALSTQALATTNIPTKKIFSKENDYKIK